MNQKSSGVQILKSVTQALTSDTEIFYVQRDCGDATPEGQAAIAIAAEKLRRPLRRLEDHLASDSHLVAECLRYAQGHAPLIAEFPAVKAWLGECQSRPAFQKMWAARLAEPEDPN